jgi:tetratricopeptide (TPR) repeat protein
LRSAGCSKQGNLAGALQSYKAALAIAERLVKSNPDIAGWQNDLASTRNNIGDVLKAQGNLTGALEAYKAALDIVERLDKSDPNNTSRQLDLILLQNNVGDVLHARGNLRGALEAYKASFTILERFTKSDPSNAEWQRNAAESLFKIARMQLTSGNSQEGRATYRQSLAIRQKLAAVMEVADMQSSGKPGEATAEALGNVSWDALFAGEYATALDAADRALGIAPTALWIQSNRAHALMLVGRTKEARTIYLAHRGEKVAENADKPW